MNGDRPSGRSAPRSALSAGAVLATLAVVASALVIWARHDAGASRPGPATPASPGGSGASVAPCPAPGSTTGSTAVPTTGSVTAVAVPGPASGFAAKDVWVYLPPAWCRLPARRFPVLVLLPGVPDPVGGRYWVDLGVAVVADAFAAAHDGLAPVIVMPDAGGLNDTECIDSDRFGKVETYLTVDVANWLRSWDVTRDRLVAGPDGAAVGGFSMGGTCALMLALRHPDLWRTFADFAGDYFGVDEGVSRRVQKSETVEDLLAGNTALFDQYDPARRMAKGPPPGLAGWFEVAADDDVVPHVRAYAGMAERAGIETCWRTVAGLGHDGELAAGALHDALPWLAARTGLAPFDTEIRASCTPP